MDFKNFFNKPIKDCERKIKIYSIFTIKTREKVFRTLTIRITTSFRTTGNIYLMTELQSQLGTVYSTSVIQNGYKHSPFRYLIAAQLPLSCYTAFIHGRSLLDIRFQKYIR